MIINVRKVKGIYTQSLDLGLDAKTMYNNSPETEINHDGSGKLKAELLQYNCFLCSPV